jgi:hypothetical protein
MYEGSKVGSSTREIHHISQFTHTLRLIRYTPHAYASAHRTFAPHSISLDVLAEPANTLTVTLSHNDTAHEHLDRPDALERHLALPSGLVQTQSCPKLVFGNCVRVVDLVPKDDEGGVGQLLHSQEGVELSF